MTFEIWWIDRSIRWRRWLVDLMRFLCYELGVSCDDDNGLIKAKIKPHVLQNKVDDFIDMFVLCPVCALPETDFKVVSNSTATKAKLQLSCRACGAYSAPSDRASGHKLAKFIVVNQLDNSAYQAAIARDDAGDAIFELASKLSISGMDQELSASLVRELNDDEDRSVEGSQAFSEDTEQQEDDDDDDDNDWAISTDGAAMEARQQANITGRLKSLALGNATTCDDTNGTEGSALEPHLSLLVARERESAPLTRRRHGAKIRWFWSYEHSSTMRLLRASWTKPNERCSSTSRTLMSSIAYD